MHEDRKVVLDGASPERIEARIVDGHADRRDREERDGPRLLRATLDLLDRAVNVPPRSQDDALQPRGMGPAVVGHVAVVRLVHGQLEPDVVGAGEAVDSARRDDDVDVHALDVRVGVEDLEPVFPHWTLPVNAHPESASATPAPGTARRGTRLSGRSKPWK